MEAPAEAAEAPASPTDSPPGTPPAAESPLPPVTPRGRDPGAGARRIQRAFRRHQQLKADNARRYVKLLSLVQLQFYYQDPATGESQWTPPKGCEALRGPEWLTLPAQGKPRPPPLAAEAQERELDVRHVAAERIQTVARRYVAMQRLPRVTKRVYRRLMDEGSGSYYYTHTLTGAVSWDPPRFWPALRPDDDDEASDEDRAEDEHRTLMLLEAKRRDPHEKRQRQLARRALNRAPAAHPSGMYAKLGAVVPVLDGVKRVYCEIDPHLLARAAFEKGPVALLRVMEQYPTTEVIYHAFDMLSRYDLEHDPATGRATQEAVDVMEATCDAMVRLAGREPLIGRCLQALASLSHNYANRRVLMRRNVTELVRDAVENLDLRPNRVPGREQLEYVSSHGLNIATYSLHVLAQMGEDMANRELVAQDGIGVAISAMKTCFLDATVQGAGMTALYNLIYRNQVGHDMALAMGARVVVVSAKQEFSSDADLQRRADRLEALLEPEGWRGINA